MKHIKYLLFILSISLSLVFSGCESDPNGRMPDDIADSNVGVLILESTSDVLVDANDFASLNVDFEVDVLFDDAGFEQIDVMVVYNGDYENQYLVSSVTSVPTKVSYSIDDIVSAVETISSSADIEEGDSFNFFTSIHLEDGTFIPGYLPSGHSTNAPSVRNIMGILKGGLSSFLLPVPCPFQPEDFVGTSVDVYEQWNDGSGDAAYPAEVSINTDLSTDDMIVYDIVGLFTGGGDSFYQIAVDKKTYSVSHYVDKTRPEDEYEMVVDVDLFGWGYGRLWFEDFTEPLLETCKSYIQFTVTPTLNDTGLWFGSTVTYYIGDGAIAAGSAKKSAGDYTGPKDEAILKAFLVER